MSKVWKRLQRVGKRAAKFKFTTFAHTLSLECDSKWQANKLYLVWTHRDRKYSSRSSNWEPGLADVFRGVVEWKKQTDLIEFDVTLYKNMNEDHFEEKEWILMIEDEDTNGKRKILATGKFFLEKYANFDPFCSTDIKDFQLKIVSNKIRSAKVSFTFACQFLKDGKATDEDMISIASYMSTTSLNTPYMKKRTVSGRKTFGLDDSDFEENVNDKTLTSKAGGETTDETNEMDYWFKLQASQITNNFNRIANNYSQVAPDDITFNSTISSLGIDQELSQYPTWKKKKDKQVEKNTLTQQEESNPFVESDESILTSQQTPTKTSINTSSSTSKDLLDWCAEKINMSKNASPLFKNLTVKDYSASWMNGLAFCALIYHFRPNSIELKSLSTENVKSNLKQVFTLADNESIARVIDYSDFVNKKSRQLDTLSIMTFLYQLRNHFESSSTVREINNNQNMPSEAVKNEVKPSTRVNYPANPFDSDDENTTVNAEVKKSKKNENTTAPESKQVSTKSSEPIKPASNQSSEELIKKAQDLIEKNKTTVTQSPGESLNKDELKQKAREMLKQSRKVKSGSKEATSTKTPEEEVPRPIEEPINKPELISNQITQVPIIPSIEEEDENLGAEYISQEIQNLKAKQAELDEEGSYIEKQLRLLMKKNSERGSSPGERTEKDKELEDKLLRGWFLLVNQKNALLYRQQELEILRNEKNLERRYELLSNQLRQMMQIDDFNKTSEQKKIEQNLFNELISLVNKRNELVLQLDEENKLFNEDQVIDNFIQSKSTFIPKEKQCSIQ